MVLKNYKCVSPNDDLEDFKKFDSCTISVQKLLTSLESSASADKAHLAEDLPLALLDFFEVSIIAKLMHAKGF